MPPDGFYRYAVGVGGNLGNVPATLARAADLLTADGMVTISARAPLIETAAVGGPAQQPAFSNGAWLVSTRLGPHQLLHRLQNIESACGRVRTVRWGPRTCDLDLLLREDGLIVASPVLTVPHPRLCERAFVLEPLAAIAGAWRHPLAHATVAELAGKIRK